MIRAGIVRSIELQFVLLRQEASLQVEQILTLIKSQLTAGDRILIGCAGQWKAREKKSRIGRNPKSKEEYEVSARRVVTFDPSNVLREELSNDGSDPK